MIRTLVEVESALRPWLAERKLSSGQILLLHRLRRMRRLQALNAPAPLLDTEAKLVGQAIMPLSTGELAKVMSVFEAFAARYREIEGDVDSAEAWADVEDSVDRRDGVRQAVLDRGYVPTDLAPHVLRAFVEEQGEVNKTVALQLDYLEDALGIDWIEENLLGPIRPKVTRNGGN